MKRLRSSTLAVGALGLVFGLIVAALASVPLSYVPGGAGDWLPLAALVIAVPASTAMTILRERDIVHLFRSAPQTLRPFTSSPNGTGPHAILVDTSAIIDGRIADVASTGFIHDPLVIPRFVLDELQHIADSPDAMRRARGRRGLEALSRIRRESKVQLDIADLPAGGEEVDRKLVELAKKMHAAILTTDFNLNRVAEIEGIPVLNINELANALRPVLLPGQDLQIRVVQEGKEIAQGLGFLDDGTMVVVEGGRKYMGSDIAVVVTRILQTNAGRIVFAQPKA